MRFIMKLTTPILRDIAQQITLGNPLLGLAVANEYLRPSTPLHKALAAQVCSRINTGFPHSAQLVDQLLSGKRCSELTRPLRAELGKRSKSSRGRTLPVPTTMWRRTAGDVRRPPAPRLLRKMRALELSQLRVSGDLSPDCARSSCSSTRRS
jgi:hypothetical protein